MAYTADGKKVRRRMKVYDRVLGHDRTMTVQDIRGNDLLIGTVMGVGASSVYSSKEARTKSERILIFGGTFDPIHNGHLIACRGLAESLGINRVILIPSGKHPYKHNITSAEDRLEMTRLSVEDEYLFEVCDCEFNREGFSYSADTSVWIKQELYKKMDEVYWVIGADNVKEIPKWYKAAEFVKEVRFAVAAREAEDCEQEETEEEKEIMKQMHVTYVDTPIIEISSSMVRDRVQEGQSIKYLVSEAVEKHIRDNGLYQ